MTIGGSNFQVQVGNSITIGCTVTANPAVTSVYWTRDINGQSTIIGPSSNPSKYGGSTTVTPSLTILNADISDAGNYQCFATNNIGTGSSQQALLDVQGCKIIIYFHHVFCNLFLLLIWSHDVTFSL